MELVFLYGPPAVGKLTVAKELEKLTGYGVFHNHLSVDLVASVLRRGVNDPLRFRLINKYRLELIAIAAKEGVSLIFTFVYAKAKDDAWVKKVVQAVKKHGGRVCFVQLYCESPELAKRLRHPSRKKFTKIKEQIVLKETMRNNDLLGSVPYRENLRIDNTTLSPRKVAHSIQRHFGLGSER